MNNNNIIPCVTEYPGLGAFLFETFAKPLQIMQHQTPKSHSLRFIGQFEAVFGRVWFANNQLYERYISVFFDQI
jgi:hypothetical protein